ncbi:translation initiation factor IF-2 [Slackia sp. CM382]|uniref:translation initiation factor IF-2 n=1 Tax=Slackia sp. CM382 TaxID=1111137 RepID=UPI0005870510|nr:translation initiation factor IF-2 [Slackia sp. CM382]
MPNKRVHELAKEFGMDSKELLARIQEMKIPAKSHASMLAEPYVDKIRKALAPEIGAKAAGLDKEAAEAIEAEQEAENRRKEAEEAERRKAVEHERALRDAERARRGSNASAPSTVTSHAAQAKKVVASETSGLSSLARQIEENRAAKEREREETEKRRAQRAADARAAKIAAEVAKKRAVEERLRSGSRKSVASSAPAAKAAAPAKKAPVMRKGSSFDSLLSQIESEKARIDAEAQTKKASPARERGQAAADASRGRRGKQGGRRSEHHFEPEVPELVSGASKDDRYAQMAVQVEQLQRDKVLAEARAAVAAATSNEGEGRRRRRKEKREAEQRERIAQEAIEKGIDPDLMLDDSVVEIAQGATVGDFSDALGVPSSDVIKRLFLLGQVLTVTQSMSDELIELIADDMGRKVRVVSPEEEYSVAFNDKEEDLKPRPPVVTVMGHVDHGKTSLLDAIRSSGVALSEAGGITQHIGASVVEVNGRQVTFIDTPGHEAFTAMRARGAQVTDVVVLVVAADDGVMPQTIEAIHHAEAAGVPIVVAVNKIDKPGANPDRVRQELVEYNVIPEEWGGKNMFVNVSAKKKEGIDDLLETILLQSDVLELKANPDATASGFVIESKLDKGRGPVATVLVQRGTLNPGDVVVAGQSYGRVRALVDPRGNRAKKALPADPVEVLGLSSVPAAGDEFRVFEDERDARKLAEERALRARLKEQEARSHVSLDDLFNRIEEGQSELNLVVKADVQGSIEALRDAFAKMDQSEVKISIIHSAVGGVTETDVTLAAASDAIIIGFNVRPTAGARAAAEREKVDVRLYRVIYQAIEDINAARVGMLSPDIVEKDTGSAEVRDVFRVPKVGNIAGCYITEGELSRDDRVRIVRDSTVIFEGNISSLRRFKDDVKTVKQGYECGIGVDGYQDIKVGDVIEGYRVEEVERTA